ncbi:hypothetical protein HMN09_00900300 [Mycena chlorophos]|uniref:Uncharacterized protein n=1 Tax=Mycena chlorophos TaxID=658473 RepID=A0A8H6W2K6_MYCCL|nr:hypothetical protein HMN09_00900300 [Mycena chlorophos]
MANEHALPQFFLNLFSSLKSNALQYAALGTAILAITAYLMRSHLAHNCMTNIERRIRDIKDEIDKAEEEHAWSHHTIRRKIEADFASRKTPTRVKKMGAAFLQMLLDVLSELGNNALVYLAFIAVFVGGAVNLVGPLRTRVCMRDLERILHETRNMLDRGREEGMLCDKEFRLDVQLRLAKTEEVASSLRSRLLQKYGPECSPSMCEYFGVFGIVARKVRGCRRDVRGIQMMLLRRIEGERRKKICEHIQELEWRRGGRQDQG